MSFRSMVWYVSAAWTVIAGAVVGFAQQTSSLGNGLSAAAIARGGAVTAEQGDPLDAVEGNPAGLARIARPVLDATAVGVLEQGSFRNLANADGRLSGVAGVMPYGAFAMPLGRGRKWVGSAAFTPEILLRANWQYNDAPGTAGASYGFQTQETQIIAMRSSLGLARTFGSHWAAGVTSGVVYNTNDLHAPYIFQQQPQLAGLKVLLALTTHGLGLNASGGVLWEPTSRMRLGLAYKSGTSLHTHGDATGTASAQFAALGIAADPTFRYSAKVENHLPQGFSGGLSWKANRWMTWKGQGDFTAWGQAFQQLPIKLTGGTNATINSVAGSTTLVDAVPLHWNNQVGLHVGVESPVGENATLRAGYGWMSNPVPSSTLIPLTAAIMQQSVGLGGGWTRGRLRLDAAYQVQLPSTEYVGKSSILAGEYDNSRLRLMTQSVTLSTTFRF